MKSKRVQTFRSRQILLGLVVLLSLFCAPSLLAQEGRLVREKVHGKSLEKTLTGEAADRNVSIYLPPSYDTSPVKRYPVLYLLHGITDTDETWTKPWAKDDPWSSLPGVMNRGIAEKRFGEIIVVMPDEKTNWGGSFYTNSVVTGNWEDFTVRDLVSYIDGKYRTLARTSSRGIAGHSMGGYGAIKLGMKYPEVYSVVYGINPAVLGWGQDLSPENPGSVFSSQRNRPRPNRFPREAFTRWESLSSPRHSRPIQIKGRSSSTCRSVWWTAKRNQPSPVTRAGARTCRSTWWTSTLRI